MSEFSKEIILDIDESYKHDRSHRYDRVKEQLDNLYHDIDNGLLGEEAKTGNFYLGIRAVKDANPKPV